MQIEIGVGTLLGIIATIFFGMLGILITFLYKISINTASLNTTIDSKLEITNNTLSRIERDLNILFRSPHPREEISRSGSHQGDTDFHQNVSNEPPIDFPNEEGMRGGTTGDIVETDTAAMVIKTSYRDKVTIVNVEPKEPTEEASKPIQERDPKTLVLPYHDTGIEQSIKEMSTEILGVEPDVYYDGSQLSVIIPYVERAALKKWHDQLVQLLKREANW